jgi:hypothetical protein
MRQTVAALVLDLDLAKSELMEQVIAIAELRKELKAAESKHEAALVKLSERANERTKDIAALKAELFEARQIIARQEGYIARALEDDNMRELGPSKNLVPTPPQPEPQSRRMGVAGWNDNPSFRSMATREVVRPWHDR